MDKHFISFEGIDGVGKGTQLNLLAEYLRGASGVGEIITTHEPYNKMIAQLLHEKAGAYDPLTQLFLLSASRRDHVENVIRPHLAKGGYVLCDRYTDSTFAYQGYGLGLSLDRVAQMNQLATGGLAPDISFFLDIDVHLMTKRLELRGQPISSYERLPIDFYCKVREGFLTIAKKSPDRCKIIDANRTQQEIAKEIREYLR